VKFTPDSKIELPVPCKKSDDKAGSPSLRQIFFVVQTNAKTIKEAKKQTGFCYLAWIWVHTKIIK
jgi:hypothetical protein